MSSNKRNSAISSRLKTFEKEKTTTTNNPSNSNHTNSHAGAATTPPPAPPAKVSKSTVFKLKEQQQQRRSLLDTSPMAQRQYFHDSAASSMTVPELVDRFNEQIELNEMALAQEAEEKQARRERYLQSRKYNRKNAKAKRALLAKKEQQKQASNNSSGRGSNNKISNHYSLVKTPTAAAGGGGMLMNGTPSFSVDPRTYQPPENLPQPTQPEAELLWQALTDTVLLKEKRSANSKNNSFDNNSSDNDNNKVITTTTQELRDALVKAFETVLIKKGQTVEEAVEQSGNKHFDENCLYVIESGEIDLNDGETGKRVATATAGDTIGGLHTILQPHLMGGKAQAKRREMRAQQDSRIFRLSDADYRGIIQSQAKQANLEKEKQLQKLPFLNKLIAAKDAEARKKGKKNDATDAIERITDIMRPVYFRKGDTLPSRNGEILYVVKEGNLKLTSDQQKQFVLGPGNHIGRKALMGTQGNEPTVQNLEAVSDGSAYMIEKAVADKVLGQNFVSRETSRLDDATKLANFHCIKSANLKPATLDLLAAMIEDRILAPGTLFMKQGEQVEPCLYLVRQGQLTLSTDDGSFSHIVKAGGSFGVEQLLMPMNKQTGTEVKPTKDTRLPAQWNVRVSSTNEPCIIGILSLIDCQEILDNNERALPEAQQAKPVVPKKKSSKHVEEQKEKIKNLVKSNVQLNDLERLSVIGEGAFGEVWKVKTDLNGAEEFYALKKVTKEKEVLDALKREVIFLTKFGVHPFVVSLIKIFEDQDHRYMLMNLAEGGELWDVVHREEADGTWTSGLGEEHAKFYAFLLADTLSFIHSKKYVYRDMKAENVLIDSDGYPILCDFGFTKYVPDKTYTACGTPNYVAPEIITSEGHNEAVDWWALGVLLYEMVCGDHPFFVDGMDQVDVFESIIHEQHMPVPGGSKALCKLVDGLLEKEPSYRLGMLNGRAEDIMSHKCFDGMDIVEFRTRKIKAPWIPPKKQNKKK
ncbi:protein kinase domain containing protein [Nitzschia inconspicua]|uniref:Protein kinase domain containing protein n=1 Tax=Nitzschia inconspicua TaxID=303405 RepID=A0A9K3Q5X9_9STRA|nr:protein kinase domain containing protein [Nitzschia inconspicua]